MPRHPQGANKGAHFCVLASLVMERTLALIKPDAVGVPWLEELLVPAPPPDDGGEGGGGGGAVDAVAGGADDAAAAEPALVPRSRIRAPDKAAKILARVAAAGFTVVQQRRLVLSVGDAEAFLRAARDPAAAAREAAHLASGPCLALLLERAGAVAAWQELMGPADPAAAVAADEAAHPLDDSGWCLRALFGTDATRNAVHGSDTPADAEREARFFFPPPGAATRLQRSVAVVTPDAVAAGATAGVVAALEADGFVVLAVAAGVRLTPEVAEAALGADATPPRVCALTAGPVDVLLVEAPDGVWRLRDAAGLHPPSTARVAHPACFHATLGRADDDVSFGVVAAPSEAAVADALLPTLFPGPLRLQQTLALLKPGAAAEQHYTAILAAVDAAGFTVVAERRLAALAPEDVDLLLYAEHVRSASPQQWAALRAYMSSGPLVALALTKPAAVKAWRALAGPTDPVVARRERPRSLRALYGSDALRNGLHASASPEAAARELRFFFPDLHVEESGGTVSSASEYVRTAVVCDAFDPRLHAMAPRTLGDVLTDGLLALARAKPSSSPAEATAWLGQWLADNNPRTGIVTYADGARTTTSATGASRRRGGRGAALEPPQQQPAASQQSLTIEELPTTPKAAATAVAASATGSAAQPCCSSLVFVVGTPTAGVSAHCARVAAAFGYSRVDGEAVAAAVGVSGDEAAPSDDQQARAVAAAVAKAAGAGGSGRVLLEGFPASLPQALALERALGGTPPALVLSLTTTLATAPSGADSGALRPMLDFYAGVGRLRTVDVTADAAAAAVAVDAAFQPTLVWLTGPPGAGKTAAAGTALRDGNALGYRLLSVNDLLGRHAAAAAAASASASADGSPVAVTAAQAAELVAAVARGDADVPPGLLVALVRDAVNAAGPTGRFLLDGAPATPQQAAALEAAFGPPAAVVQLGAPDDVLLPRVASPSPSTTSTAAASKALAAHRLAAYRAGAKAVAEPYRQRCLLRPLDASRGAGNVAAALRALLAPRVVFVLGGPGTGKGTQCARTSRAFGFAHLSVGDLLRAEVARGSRHGDAINRHIAEGRIVPLETTLALLAAAMRGSAGASAFLIDGFPRALEQAAAFEAAVCAAEFVLFLDAPEDVMTARLLERGKSSGRVDDNAAAIGARLRTYAEASLPVVEHYAAQGRVRLVDATPHPDAVYAAVRAVFEPRLVVLAGRPGAGASTAGRGLCASYPFVAHVSLSDLLEGDTAARAAVAAAAAAATAACKPAVGTTTTSTAPAPNAAATAATSVADDDGESLLAAGRLSTPAALALVTAAIARCGKRVIALEGFPRNADDAAALEVAFGGPPACVVHLDAPADVAAARVTAREASRPHLATPQLAAVVASRLAAWEAATAPVLKAYARRGLLRSVPAGSASPPAAVLAALRPLLQPQLAVLVAADGAGREELAVAAGRELGYATLRVGRLLRAHVAARGRHAAVIAAALAAGRTVPAAVAADVIADAVAAATASSPSCTRFLLDGFPRVVHDGAPGVHDQLFALEAAVGPVKGCVSLAADWDARVTRTLGGGGGSGSGAAPTPGQLAELRARVETAQRETGPVAAYFAGLGKAVAVDTTARTGAQVYEAVRPFLE